MWNSRSVRFGGRLVALLLALLVLVAPLDGLLHLVEEAHAESACPCDETGPVLEAYCGDGPCHDPDHEHRQGHDHDVASCARCSVLFQSFDAPAPGSLAVVAPATRESLGIVPSADVPAPAGSRPPSRAPPSLSR
jgi:hypothetical protein